jgi:hypothetical protein
MKLFLIILIYFSLQSPQYLIEETCTHSFIKQNQNQNQEVWYYFDCDTYLEAKGYFKGVDSIKIDNIYKPQIIMLLKTNQGEEIQEL